MERAADRAPTIKDVAAAAGVSYQTVSRVLNSDPKVSEATRRAVDRAISTLQYQPNAAARALVTGRSTTVGALVEDLRQYGSSGVLAGVDRAAGLAGWDVSTVNIQPGDAAAASAAFAVFGQRRVRAVLLINATQAVAAAALEQSGGFRLLGTSQTTDSLVPATVEIDQRAGVRAAIEHLVDGGRQRIAHLAGPASSLDAQLRQHSTVQHLGAAGLCVAGVVEGNWSARSGAEGVARLLDERSIDAVFAANDHMALGVMSTIKARGYQIPRDIAVVGFDDVPEAAYFDPPLTTVRQDFLALGRELFTAARRFDQNTSLHSVAALQPELVRRSST